MRAHFSKIFYQAVHVVGAVAIGVCFGAGAHAVLGWTTPPTGNPPAGNVAGAPITTAGGQIKQGGLTLNSAGLSTLGLIVANGAVAIGTTTPNATLKLAVAGKVGAQQYCDQYGNNCVSTPSGGGGGQQVGGPSPRWHDVGADRKFSHLNYTDAGKQNEFTNNRPYPIMVSASTYSGVLGGTCVIYFTVDGVAPIGWQFTNDSPTSMCSSSVLVPAGSTYKVHSGIWKPSGGVVTYDGRSRTCYGPLSSINPSHEGKQFCTNPAPASAGSLTGGNMWTWFELYTD